MVRGAKAGATLKGNTMNLGGNAVGVEVDGGRALLENNNLTGCAISAIQVDKNGRVDAGDCRGRNLSGLGSGSYPGGSSAGGNDLSGYGFDRCAPWAIVNSGAIVAAERNVFGASSDERIGWVISGAVDFSQTGGMQLCAPPLTNVEGTSDIPAPIVRLEDFLEAGGNASVSSGTLISADQVGTNAPGEYVVRRKYTLIDACGEQNSCEQLITVRENGCRLSVSRGSLRGVTLALNARRGNKYALLTTTDFLDWKCLGTNTAPFIWTDNNVSLERCRFYKALFIP